MMVERWIEGDRNARMRLDQTPARRRESCARRSRSTAPGSASRSPPAAPGSCISPTRRASCAISSSARPRPPPISSSGCSPRRPISSPAGRASRSASICAPGRASRARCSTRTPSLVTYQGWRGEPRGRTRRAASWEGRGHCIDCQACVAVCPMGIDIRDGSQLECIGCGLCIDACDEVMEKVGLPTKLIGFDTERNREAKAAGKTARWHPIRPRTIAYAGLLLLAGLALLGSLLLRSDLDINVLPDRTPLFVRLSDGRIHNAYTIKILNMQRAERRFTLAARGPGRCARQHRRRRRRPSPRGAAGRVATYRVLVNLPPAALSGDTTEFAFQLTDRATGAAARHETVFKGPGYERGCRHPHPAPVALDPLGLHRLLRGRRRGATAIMIYFALDELQRRSPRQPLRARPRIQQDPRRQGRRDRARLAGGNALRRGRRAAAARASSLDCATATAGRSPGPRSRRRSAARSALRSTLELALQSAAPGLYRAPAELPLAGQWDRSRHRAPAGEAHFTHRIFVLRPRRGRPSRDPAAVPRPRRRRRARERGAAGDFAAYVKPAGATAGSST